MTTAIKSKKQAKTQSTITTVIKYINTDDLLPNPYQPDTRVQVDPEVAKKFGLSIQEHGLIQIPVVRSAKTDGKFEVGDGWLRRAGFCYLASNMKDSPYKQMPCEVRDLTDQQMADLVMEANTIRKDLNPIELAKFYGRYLEEFGITQQELARRHNCSQGEIANTIRLLELPADIQEKIISQEISETHGRQLLRLNTSPELQQKELEDVIKRGCSVNELANSITSTIYHNSKNLDPDDYPLPKFDIKECENCPNRQKLGTPYSSKKKEWRCLDPACYEKKEEKAEEDRVAKLREEIAAAQAAAPKQPELQVKGKGKKKKDKGIEAGVVDTSKLTWRDYQRLDMSFKHLDNPEKCKTCPNRAIGLFWGKEKGPICINVKCFQQKEKAYQAKEAVKTRQAENDLTNKIKEVCDQDLDQATVLKVVADHLILHSRKDTLQKFGKMYDIADPSEYFANSSNGDTLQKLAALVIQKERYEGEQGVFMKLMAEVKGTVAELEKQLTDFKEKHCKTCTHESSRCLTLMRVYYKGQCYLYSKKGKGEEEEEEEAGESEDKVKKPESKGESNPESKAEKPESEVIEESLPCNDCQNKPTCDRTFFYADGEGGLACDNKVSAGAREEVTDAV